MDLKNCKVIRTVYGGELEKLTSSGWILLACLTETGPETVETWEKIPILSQGSPFEHLQPGYCNNTTTHKTQAVTVTRPVFLLGLEEDSVLAKTEETIRALRMTVSTLTTRAHDAESKASKSQKLMEERDGTILQGSVLCETLKNQLDVKTKQVRKLEGDIAKIRTAIGEREMRRILTVAETA